MPSHRAIAGSSSVRSSTLRSSRPPRPHGSAAATCSSWVGDCLLGPKYAGDRIDASFGLLDVAGNFSGWADMPVEIPSHTEARAAVDAQAGDPPTSVAAQDGGGCSIRRNGARGVASMSLALGLIAAAVLRARVKSRCTRQLGRWRRGPPRTEHFVRV